MAKIFISYKRLDKDIVFPIVETIKKHTNLDCWIDLNGIESGDQFEHVIIKAINECDIVVFMMSQNSISSYVNPENGLVDYQKQTWTEREVKFALDKGKRVIPLSIDGTNVSECDWLAFNLSGVDSIDWHNSDQRNKFLYNLSVWCDGDSGDVSRPVNRIELPKKLPNYLRIAASAVLLIILAGLCGWFFFSKCSRNAAGDENVIPECSAQLYPMRYKMLNSIYENAFTDSLLSFYCYDDSIINDTVYIFPKSDYLTLDSSVPVIVSRNDGNGETSFPYHNPVIQLKIHSNYDKTVMLNNLELEVTDFEKDNEDVCRFELAGQELRMYNEGSTIVSGSIQYSPLRKGEVPFGYTQNTDVEFSDVHCITLGNGAADIAGMWNGCYKLVSKDVTIPTFQECPIDIPSVEINGNGLQPVTETCSTKIGEQDGFTHSLISGETDDETYMSVRAPYSCKMRVRAVLTDIKGQKIFSPYVYLHYLKPRSGKLYPKF